MTSIGESVCGQIASGGIAERNEICDANFL